MQLVGKIVQLQVQRESLKVGERPNRVYDPTPLMAVDQIKLTPTGVVGLTEDGKEITDVHNGAHPRSKNSGNMNGISFNFVPHYEAMRGQFGQHLINGCAGENILINTEEPISLDDLGGRLTIKNANTGQMIDLEQLAVAAPCAEFSCYVAQEKISGEQLKNTLQFLDSGTRGFYATLSQNWHDAVIQAGDEVYIRS